MKVSAAPDKTHSLNETLQMTIRASFSWLIMLWMGTFIKLMFNLGDSRHFVWDECKQK